MSRRPLKQRRAFSVLRGGGRVESGGEPGLARQLVRALRAARDQAYADSVTHGAHPYAARMHPSTARGLLVALGARAVLDPFCGSGTTLVEARRLGIRAAGVDLSPLAVWIARSKTWTATAARRVELLERAEAIAGEAVAEGARARRAGGNVSWLRRPERNRALGGWFAPHVRREVERLAAAIDQVERDDAELAEPLRVSLSAILYKVSRRTSETDPTPIDRQVARGAPSRLFFQRVERLCAGLEELAAEGAGPMPIVRQGDARRLSELGLGHSAFDAVVTSPPYGGVYDYAEQHRLRMAFFGMSARRFARGEIGARRRMEARGDRGTRSFRRDLAAALAEIGRSLRPGGRAALVMGDSVAAGRVLTADQLIREGAPEELWVEAWAWEERTPRGRVEVPAFSGEALKREHVLLLRRR